MSFHIHVHVLCHYSTTEKKFCKQKSVEQFLFISENF